MWLELLQIFRSSDPLKALADEFTQMLQTTHEMATIVRPHIFDHSLALEQRERIYALDIQVNKLERSIRKRVVSHITLHSAHVPYCLLLMSLVKDVERIGDYIKNISEVSELGGSEVPAGALRDELESLVNLTMQLFDNAPNLLAEQDREQTTELIMKGRNGGKRSDRLVTEIAKADLSGAQTTSLVLLTRFYKRIGAHLINVLSSVVMPLHKIDFYNEKDARAVSGEQTASA